MGHAWPAVRTMVERPQPAECRARALDVARTRIWSVEAPDRERYAALRIVEITLEDHGHRPDDPFPLTRERMAVPPKRSNRYAPRKRSRDSDEGDDKPKPKRSKWNVIDRFARDPRVIRLRERLGFLTASTVQGGLKLIEVTGVFIVHRPGKAEGKRRNLANAWMFGTEIADHLSKALLGRKSELNSDQNRASRLSDFVVQGAKRHGVDLVASLVGEMLDRASEAKKVAATALQRMWSTKKPTGARPEAQERPRTIPEPTEQERGNASPGGSEAKPEPPDPAILAKVQLMREMEGTAAPSKLSAAALKPRGPARLF